MQITPYLMFNGRTEEALEFYKKALGAEVVMLMRFKDNPDPKYNPPNSDEKIMHSSFKVGAATVMASDGDCGGAPTFSGVSLALSVTTPDEAERCFNALAADGQVQMPIGETFFSPRFGMVADKFGVHWMVMAEPKG
jgi:PhnB protein